MYYYKRNKRIVSGLYIMAYDLDTLLPSEAAYTVLRQLYLSDSEYGMYAKEIAEESNLSRHTVSTYIKSLRDYGLIKRNYEKRSKAQYYEIDFEGISKFTRDFWDQKKEEVEKGEHSFQDSDNLVPFNVQEGEKAEDKWSAWSYQIKSELLRKYFELHLEHVKESTVRQMVFSNLQINLKYLLGAIGEEFEDDFKLKVSHMTEIHDRVEYDPDVMIAASLTDKYMAD
ncbi:MAG: ArsR/SmtB family transcription factor [Candidatus Nanohaloarchaea archaeon]